MNGRHISFRRLLVAAGLATSLWSLAAAQAGASAPAPASSKVLRIPFPAAETGFDFAQVSDLYSRIVVAHIFESLYGYDHLARPPRVIPEAAAAMPEVSDDFKTWTIRLRPGAYFADDPAFKGRRRELVASDFVYSFKRLYDPKLKSPHYSTLAEEGIVGLEALREAALKTKKPFDYDREVEGLRALDRYTLQIKLESPRPRFLYSLTELPGMAREVADAHGDSISEHPVGTGPYRLAQWRRSSLMVLERNPNYTGRTYDAAPAADDADGQAVLARLKGRPLPLVDRLEISIVQESQPRWLAFLNNEFDYVTVPLEFANVAVPNGHLAPNLAKRGIQMLRVLGADSTFFYFNMEDPVVGGYTPARVALRRAIGLASDVQREINTVRRGQAIPAQSPVVPHTYGYDPAFRSENSVFDLPRAKALLDMHGYIDKNGDGWRDQPDGKPLVLEVATQPDPLSREFDEIWKKSMTALGVRVKFNVGQWPEQLKQSRAGKLMVWQLGSSAASPDGQASLERGYGPSAGAGNLARFKLEAFDRIYRRMTALPDGPERLAAFREAQKLLLAYLPYKSNVHRIITDLTQPWVIGYRRPVYWNKQWHMVDVDTTKRPS